MPVIMLIKILQARIIAPELDGVARFAVCFTVSFFFHSGKREIHANSANVLRLPRGIALTRAS